MAKARTTSARISIHALLAESDLWGLMGGSNCDDFYPRSPCGERRISLTHIIGFLEFLSTLSLRRATMHALIFANLVLFLSTLSLRRATLDRTSPLTSRTISIHALLAESDAGKDPQDLIAKISIHALLAESDTSLVVIGINCVISIHALLAESDAMLGSSTMINPDFYPRSPCGERHTKL